MSWQVWLLFAVTEEFLCLSPGPAVLFVISNGLSRASTLARRPRFVKQTNAASGVMLIVAGAGIAISDISSGR